MGETAEYICERRYAAVALQLPDELLQHAADLSSALSKACTARGHAPQVSAAAAAAKTAAAGCSLALHYQGNVPSCCLRADLHPGGHHLQQPER